MRTIGTYCLLACTLLALQSTEAQTTARHRDRIAIVGAGAGGSSAAYWISRAKERFGLDVEIDVYEREGYIGGRSTTIYPYNDRSLQPLELGASLFVEINKNLWRASEEFNLTRRPFREDQPVLGIWDGSEVLLALEGNEQDGAKVVGRYGLASIQKADGLITAVVDKFLTLYSRRFPTWDTIFRLANRLGWVELISQTTDKYFRAAGVSTRYTREFLEGSTRINYGQNVDFIHALEGACSQATDGATSIRGGNFQIFEQFLQRSKANVQLNTKVASITARPFGSTNEWTVRTTSGRSQQYKAVILAAPFHTSGIALSPLLAARIPPQPYVHLHVTMLVTNSSTFNKAYFGLAPNASVPSLMLTSAEGIRRGRPGPEFNSISYHGLVRPGEWAVKIFSDHRISDATLQRILPNSVRWVYRKEWDAYPKLPPTKTFPPVKLSKGLYYVNAFEPLISTMETETIASRNVVQLMLADDFSSSICGPGATPPVSDDKFVLGWDC
ncbi:hypothetical protein HGRIS_007495 [Hohenbuehelia grisea]|uniref:Prenylcysteine lyase domain-containing protein n=1 Tax=Hohenbuehelia grisea TaxID=104357 RepID=A0ABR3J500_9AGAR